MRKLRAKVWTWDRAINSATSPFSSTQRHVAAVLANYMSPAGDSCYPSMDTLALDLDRAVSTVRDALRVMSEWGWLDREIVHGRGRSNQYVAVIPEYFARGNPAMDRDELAELREENRRRAVVFAEATANANAQQGLPEPATENRRAPVVSEGKKTAENATVKPPGESEKTAGVRHQLVQDQIRDRTSSRPTPSKSTVSQYAGNDEKTAAASESEPVPIERAVPLLATLDGWDSGSLSVIMPLLQQIPGKLFEETLAKTLARKAANPPGMLVHLLRVAIGDWRQAQNEARLATWDEFFGEAGLERVKREDPDRYVTAWATPALEAARPLPWGLVLEHIVGYVFAHTEDRTERDRLLEVFVSAAERIPSFRSLRDGILKMIDRDGVPLADIEGAIVTLTEGHPEDREDLLAFAREIHANVERERKERAA